MDNSFFAYLQRLEAILFFSGFPLIYALAFLLAGNVQNNSGLKGRLISSLPRGYALAGTLFWGFQLKKLYPDYSVEHLRLSVVQPSLVIWALLSIVFWIPMLGKRKVICLIHSLVFFLFVISDIISELFTPSVDRNVLNNDMKLYTYSLMINGGCLGIVVLAGFLFAGLTRTLRR